MLSEKGNKNSESLVLVTGGSGFLATHCILLLLGEGYKVRSTLRTPSKEEYVRHTLVNAGASTSDLERLTFVTADLLSDDGWDEAVAGSTYVLHTASPFPAAAPDHEDEVIIPARDGTLRVLRAVAKDGKVKRTVVTSSCAAIAYGHPHQDEPFDEHGWSDLEGPGVTAYIKSKTLGEKAAWEFVRSDEGKGVEMTVICPAAIYGPVLGQHYASSIKLIKTMMAGDTPGCLNIQNGVVDVRDVALLHLIAMTHEKAAGERFVAVSPMAMTMQQMALTLKERLPKLTAKVPTRVVPNFLIRAMAKVNREAATVAPALGYKREMSNTKAVTVLGWQPRSREDALVATGESLVKHGLVEV